MGLYGSKHFETLLLPQITLEAFQTFSLFSSELSSQKILFWIFSSAWLRAYSMGLLSVVGRPSVRRSSVYGIDYLLSYCMDFFQILVVASPRTYPQIFCEFLEKFYFFYFFYSFWLFYEYFLFSLTCDTMEAKTSKGYSSLKSLLNPFKPFLKFLLSGPHIMLF